MVNANILVGAIVLVVFVTIIDSYRVYQLGKEVLRLHRLVSEMQDSLLPTAQKPPQPPASSSSTQIKQSREDTIVEEVETLIINSNKPQPQAVQEESVIEKPKIISEITPADESEGEEQPGEEEEEEDNNDVA